MTASTHELLKTALDFAHRYVLEGTMDGVDTELANRRPEGNANSIGSTYAHVVLSEDQIVNGMLTESRPLSARSWAGRTGVDREMNWSGAEALNDWYRTVNVDLDACRDFGRAVHESAVAYLDSADESGLAREVEIFGMRMTAAAAFEIFVIGHANSIGGEISALKGVAGLKGYPF